jgi:glycosyltransferase involved in cell wall biosynthesis
VKRTLKVLHILNELMPSGAENMLRVAGPSFQAAGCELHVMSTGAAVGPYAQPLAEAGYTVHHRPFAKSPRFFLELARAVRSGGFDTVHLHAERGFFWYVLALRWAGVRRIVRTVHNNFAFGGLLRARRSVERRLAEWLGVRFVSIAPGVDQNERQRFGTHPRLIPNWFDSARFTPPTPVEVATARAALGIAPGRFVLLSVGNCSEVKNHALLIDALAMLADRPWLYLHAGAEQAGAPERAQAQRLGLGERIRFLGPQADVRTLLWAADLYVMPSLFEGMSIAALEALGSGTPCLFAESPGLVDLRQFVAGLHYADKQPAAFAAALRQRIEAGPKPTDAGTSGATASVHRAFGLARGVQAYAALYQP